MAHGIVAEHGGALTVESELGKGTTFVVYLPAVEAEVEPTLADVQHGVLIAGRALLVDDDHAVTAVAEAILERLGFEVTTLVDSE